MMLIVIYQGAKKKELNSSVLLIEDKHIEIIQINQFSP
jgi:hypothetical protein